MTLCQKIWAMVEPLVQAQGYEVIEVEVHCSRFSLIRIYLDGPQGINLEQCASFSRAISRLLDVEEPITGSYRLEVSSPGMDRPLRLPHHFKRYLQHQVDFKIQLPSAVKPVKKRAVLLEVTERGLLIRPLQGTGKQQENEEMCVEWEQLVSARLVDTYDFRSTDLKTTHTHSTAEK